MSQWRRELRAVPPAAVHAALGGRPRGARAAGLGQRAEHAQQQPGVADRLRGRVFASRPSLTAPAPRPDPTSARQYE